EIGKYIAIIPNGPESGGGGRWSPIPEERPDPGSGRRRGKRKSERVPGKYQPARGREDARREKNRRPPKRCRAQARQETRAVRDGIRLSLGNQQSAVDCSAGGFLGVVWRGG